jgi:hypothetical protein
MRDLHKSVLEEFLEVKDLKGYNRPKNLADIEREPVDDDVFDIPESKCGVDAFIRKNRGWR